MKSVIHITLFVWHDVFKLRSFKWSNEC